MVFRCDGIMLNTLLLDYVLLLALAPRLIELVAFLNTRRD